MKLLPDSSVWPRAVEDLRAAGHDVIWAGDWPRDPGDRAILEVAHHEERVLVTLDKDFGELAVRHGQSHSGIVRLIVTNVAQQASLCGQVLALYATELSQGAVVTADPRRIRVRLS